MLSAVTIDELHQSTGDLVRRAGAQLTPVVITDRGEPVAVLANPALLKPQKRQRTILPEFAALMRKPPKGSVVADLDSARGDR